MIKIGLYLPVFGGWFRIRGSGDGDSTSLRENEHPPTYKYVKTVALEAEKIGIHSLWIPDHMLNPIKGEKSPSLEAWTLAVGIAEATSRVIISHTTLCEAFRYPAVLAKQAVTLCEISGNRFWLSIGAGWFKREYEAYGLPFYPHDDRVQRAFEAILIIKKLFAEDRVSFSGRYYSIKDGMLEPKPDPIPPMWYAGMSEAFRNLVAKLADGWLMRGCSIDEARRYVRDMNRRLEKEGRRDLEIAIPGMAFIRDGDEEAVEHLHWLTGGEKSLLDRTFDTGLVGSPETVADKIRRLEEIGISHVLLQLTPTLEELENVKKVLHLLY